MMCRSGRVRGTAETVRPDLTGSHLCRIIGSQAFYPARSFRNSCLISALPTGLTIHFKGVTSARVTSQENGAEGARRGQEHRGAGQAAPRVPEPCFCIGMEGWPASPSMGSERGT